MTLTAELADAESPASRFLRDQFPARDAVVAIWNTEVQRLPPVVTDLDGGARAAVGGAIEWCIGLSLADTVPHADVFNMVPYEVVERILRSAGLQPVVGRRAEHGFGVWRRPESSVPSAPAAGLLRDSWMLCQYAGILRRLKSPDPAQWRQSYHTWLTTLGDRSLNPDIVKALETLWQTYVTSGHAALAQLGGPRVIQPVFDDAFAIGDLVVMSSQVGQPGDGCGLADCGVGPVMVVVVEECG